jgi:hypothetical protein
MGWLFAPHRRLALPREFQSYHTLPQRIHCAMSSAYCGNLITISREENSREMLTFQFHARHTLSMLYSPQVNLRMHRDSGTGFQIYLTHSYYFTQTVLECGYLLCSDSVLNLTERLNPASYIGSLQFKIRHRCQMLRFKIFVAYHYIQVNAGIVPWRQQEPLKRRSTPTALYPRSLQPSCYKAVHVNGIIHQVIYD